MAKRIEEALLVMAYRERIPIKSRRELETMREAARHVAEILLELRERVKPGITTAELDRFAEKAIAARGVRSSFKGYDPHGLPKYPAVLCVSVNDEIVHGIPGPRVLADGDIVSLDFGVSVDGYHGDSAVTVPVGEISEEAERLLRVSRAVPERCDGGDEARGPALGPRERGAADGRRRGILGGARVRRARHRPRAARAALDPELRRAGARAAPAAGHGVRDRADGDARDARRCACSTTSGPR